MADLVPRDERITREALERIIHRAAELQTTQRDLGDSLTESQVLELGRDVGIPDRFLQQAIFEERSRAVAARDRGWLSRFVGARQLSVDRTVPGDADAVELALGHWMTEIELLSVKRRYPDRTSWEARRDWIASLRRAFGVGGRKYVLSRAREIVGQVRQLEEGWSHVTLAADLSNLRAERAGGGAFFAIGGAFWTGVAVVLGITPAVAAVPIVAGAGVGVAIVRGNRSEVERVQVALEQVLDRLEHAEIDPHSPPETDAIVRRLTDGIKKFQRNLGV